MCAACRRIDASGYDTPFAHQEHPIVNDYLRIALIALVAVAVGKRIIPMIPVVGPQAAAML